MIKTSPSTGREDERLILLRLLDDAFCNQLIIGDIHAPMNEISDVFKITDREEIIGGWSIFNGFSKPVIIFPPKLPHTWESIRQMVNLMNLKELICVFPTECKDQENIFPWDNWPQYEFNYEHTDLAMRLTNKDVKVMDITSLPEIRAATEEDIEALTEFYQNIQKNGEFEGIFHPLQLKSDNYVVCIAENQIIGTGGTHFETPYSIQLGNIYVKKSHRNKGIGKAITTAIVLGAIKTQRVPTLFVNESNKKAQKLYKDIGFEIYNKFIFYNGIKF